MPRDGNKKIAPGIPGKSSGILSLSQELFTQRRDFPCQGALLDVDVQ
jgi:hypothetical protein